MDAVTNKAIQDHGKTPAFGESDDHPMIERTREFAISIHRTTKAADQNPYFKD